MSQRTYTIFVTLVGLVCAWVVIHWFVLSPASLTLRNALIQGTLVGFGFAVVTVEILAKIKATKVNGWVTVYDAGRPGNNMFTRTAHARLFPGPVNLPEEAMYWWAHTDGAGRSLTGEHHYIMHFPPGGLPPNNAFWSLTMADTKNHFVENPLNRYKLGQIAGEHSDLVQNPDGSLDIYIQNTAPAGHESNWLPAPKGAFNIWLRAYIPGKTILDGKYVVPPIELKQ